MRQGKSEWPRLLFRLASKSERAKQRFLTVDKYTVWNQRREWSPLVPIKFTLALARMTALICEHVPMWQTINPARPLDFRSHCHLPFRK